MKGSMLPTGRHVLLALLMSAFAAHAAAQGSGLLLAGQSLPQNQALSSPDGRVYLLVQGDGNLVLYSAQDCNLVLLNGDNQSIYQSGTANQGTGPCQLVVSGAGGGGFAVIDSNNATLYSQGAYSPPGTVPGTLPSNAVLTQDSKPFSLDGTVCLIAQSDGNVVLYNVALLAQYGSATAAAAVWDSNTFSNMMGRTNGQPQPFRLVMQSDCNLVFYDEGLANQANAIYYLATFNQGTPPCALTVSGAGGGFIRIMDSTYTALYVQPPSFNVLYDGNINFSSPIQEQQYQYYDVNAQKIFNTTTSPTLYASGRRALLPTINRILATGSGYDTTTNTPFTGAELYDPATENWSVTAPPSVDRGIAGGLTMLFDGTALAFGGYDENQNTPVATSEIYSPATASWTPAGNMSSDRSFVVLASLQNGNVLTAGGKNSSNVVLAEAEVFNVLSRTWQPVGNMLSPRYFHEMTTLLDGRVLVTGDSSRISCELFVPATSSFVGTGAMVYPRYYHRASLLPSGRVLVTGGFAVVNGALGISNVTELYDPATGAWTAGPDLPFIVYSHVQITLPSGRVFITSGYAPLQSNGDYDFNHDSVLYDEATNAFIPTAVPLELYQGFDQSSLVDTDAVLFRASA